MAVVFRGVFDVIDEPFVKYLLNHPDQVSYNLF